MKENVVKGKVETMPKSERKAETKPKAEPTSTPKSFRGDRTGGDWEFRTESEVGDKMRRER